MKKPFKVIKTIFSIILFIFLLAGIMVLLSLPSKGQNAPVGNGTLIVNPITPQNTTVMANGTHYSNWGVGGLHNVTRITQRDSIYAHIITNRNQSIDGTLCYVSDTDLYYTYDEATGLWNEYETSLWTSSGTNNNLYLDNGYISINTTDEPIVPIFIKPAAANSAIRYYGYGLSSSSYTDLYTDGAGKSIIKNGLEHDFYIGVTNEYNMTSSAFSIGSNVINLNNDFNIHSTSGVFTIEDNNRNSLIKITDGGTVGEVEINGGSVLITNTDITVNTSVGFKWANDFVFLNDQKTDNRFEISDGSSNLFIALEDEGATSKLYVNGWQNITQYIDFDDTLMLKNNDVELLKTSTTGALSLGYKAAPLSDNNTYIGGNIGGNDGALGTGNNNCFVGRVVGFYSTDFGTKNTFVGDGAGVSFKGDYNTAIGGNALAMSNNTPYEANDNTVVGSESCLSVGSANPFNGNCVFGFRSMQNNIGGTGNIWIGNHQYTGTGVPTNIDSTFMVGMKNAPGLTYVDSTSSIIWSRMDDQYLRVNGDTEIDGNFEVTGSTSIGEILTLIPRASSPSSPVDGMIYVNSTSKHIECYLNGSWRQLD